jgi:cytochrome P450
MAASQAVARKPRTEADVDFDGINSTREQAVLLGNLNFNSLGPQNAMYHRSVEQCALLMECGGRALGFGVHNCVGQMIARLEAEAVLKPLAERVASFELLAEPQHRVNNSLRTLDSLRMKVTQN